MQLPKTIETKSGERLTFVRIERDAQGEYLVAENYVMPGAGPPMHVHHRQEEALTVVAGKIGYQILGGEPQFAGVGETVVFKAGVAHRFWSAGDVPLQCTGYVRPPENFVYFLSEVYDSINRNGGERPNMIESAYLLTRYKTEFGMTDIPMFVQRFMFPIFISIGKLMGKLKRYENAPEPIR